MYECAICHGVNVAERIHCQYCGTIPAQYSVLRKPSVIRVEESDTAFYVEVLVAFGAERQEHYRGVKHQFRTVPGDYYAEA
jgi:hypothetical protein